MKLLVVDDEMLIADGMASMIMNCQDLQDIKVDKCYSAIEALQLIKNIKFDIILTDIVMPQMNGLEFLRIIKQKWPSCYVVFLTGYDDFRYVYEAIQYPNVKYLLKAEGSKKIIKVIKDLVKSMKENETNEINEDNTYNKNENLQKDIMMSILMGEIQEIDDRLFKLSHISLNCDEPLQMCLIRINGNENQADYHQKMGVYEQVCANIKNSLYKIANLFLLSYDYVNITCFLQIKDMYTLREIEEKLKAIYETYPNYGLLFILDNILIKWNECCMRYLLLKRLMNENDSIKEGVLLTKDIIKKELVDSDNNSMKENTYDNSLLSIYLERGDEKAFFLLFDKMTKDLTADKSMHNNNLLEKYFDIATIYLAYINKNNLKKQLSSKIDLYKLMRIDYHEDWSKAVNYLRDLGHSIFFLLNNSLEEPQNEIVSRVEQYIDENLYKDLTLSAIADAMYMSDCYLSRLYKKRTGKKLSDYINERKLEEAKKLLENSNKSIQKIGMLLGYSSSSNFIRFFKKNVHLTPCEYREMHKK